MIRRKTIFTKSQQPPSSTTLVTQGNPGLPGQSIIMADPPSDREKMDKLLTQAHRVLYKTKTIFPFDFFPDTIIVDENKVDIILGIFIASDQTFSIPIANINGATVTRGLFFANFTLEIEGYNDNPPPVKYLWYPDAVKVRRIITGLVTCRKEGINLTAFSQAEVRKKVEEIGRARVG